MRGLPPGLLPPPPGAGRRRPGAWTPALAPPRPPPARSASPAGGGPGARPRQIPAEAYARHAGIDAGLVVVEEVQLCCMEGRRPGGYYLVRDRLALAAGGAGTATG
jgi:hypothetical protein